MSRESEKNHLNISQKRFCFSQFVSSLKTHITGHTLFRVHPMKIQGRGGIGGIEPFILNIGIRCVSEKQYTKTYKKHKILISHAGRNEFKIKIFAHYYRLYILPMFIRSPESKLGKSKGRGIPTTHPAHCILTAQGAAERTPQFGRGIASGGERVQWWGARSRTAVYVPFSVYTMVWLGEHRAFIVEEFIKNGG